MTVKEEMETNKSSGKPSNRPQQNQGRSGVQSAIYALMSIICLCSTMANLGTGCFATAAASATNTRGAGSQSLEWVEHDARGCLDGKVVVITGANQGIGLELTKVMAGAFGGKVIMACRNMTACASARSEILQQHPAAHVQCEQLDLGRLQSVEDFASTMRGKKIHTVVHNAGVMAVADAPTVDGFETTFQVNHLAPFLLAQRLLPNMCNERGDTPETRRDTPETRRDTPETRRDTPETRGGTPETRRDTPETRRDAEDLSVKDVTDPAGWGREPRMVWVSSGLHLFGSIHEASQEEEENHCGGVRTVAFRQAGLFPRFRAYAHSKLLNAVTAAEGHNRWAALGVGSVSVRPGTVATAITRHSPLVSSLLRSLPLPFLRSPRHAARGIALAAVHPRVEGGGYYDEGKLARVNPTVTDRNVTRQAWDTSLSLLEEWALRTDDDASREESPSKAGPRSEIAVSGWNFDLPASLETWRGAQFVPSSAGVAVPQAEDDDNAAHVEGGAVQLHAP